MCLAIPSKVLEIHRDGTATVDTMGIRRRVSLEILGEEVERGDYLLIHVGFAIKKLDMRSAHETLRLIEEISCEGE